MAGTPAQQANARKVEDQGRQNLTKTEAVETAAPATDTQKQAAEKMENLNALGATKDRIQGLVQQTLANVQSTPTPNMQVASDALAGIANPAVRTEAQQALEAYSQNPTEENMKAVYDIMGRAGLDTGISQMFQPQADTLEAAAKSTLPTGPVTLGTLDLASAGVDLNQVASALDMTPEEVSQLSLEQLNQKIDAVQSTDFQSTAQLQARLADPSISPQERQQVLDKLKQSGVAGIVGVEAEVDKLQSDLSSARMISLAGSDYTIEELLGDDGVSALIKQAVTDPRKMAELLKDERTKGLGEWITENKAALSALSDAFDTQSADFLTVQDNLSNVKSSLGEGNDSVISAILGSDLPSSITSAQMAELEQQLAGSGVYQALKGNAKLTQELKESPEVLQALVASGMDADSINAAVEARDALQADPLMQKLLGVDAAIPTTPEELEAAQAAIERYESIDPRILSSAQAWVDSDNLSLDDIELIADSDNPDQIFQDLQSWKQVNQAFSNAIKGVSEENQAMTALFGSSDFSPRDLEAIMKQLDGSTQQQILDLFDIDGDGTVDAEEMHSVDALGRVKQALGVGSDASSIVGQGGQFLGEKIKNAMAAAGVDKNSFEKAAKTSVQTAIAESKAKAVQAQTQLTTKLNEAYGALTQAQQSVYNAPAVVSGLNQLTAAFNVAGSGIGGGYWDNKDQLASASVSDLEAMLKKAQGEYNSRYNSDEGKYKSSIGAKDYNKGAADAQLAAMQKLITARKEAERAVEKAQAQVTFLDKQNSRLKYGIDNMNNQLSGMDKLNEDQLYELMNYYKVL